MAGELSAVGALGFELGFGSLGSCSFGVGEGALRFALGGVAFAERVAFAGGVVAGRGGLPASVLLGCGDLGRGVAAELVQLAGQRPACGFLRVPGGVAGGGGVVAGGGEGLAECLGLGFGFCLAGLGGDGGGLGAAAGGLGVGDVGADAGGVERGGLVACGPGEDRGLAECLLEGCERVGVLAAGGGGGGDAGVVTGTGRGPQLQQQAGPACGCGSAVPATSAVGGASPNTAPPPIIPAAYGFQENCISQRNPLASTLPYQAPVSSSNISCLRPSNASARLASSGAAGRERLGVTTRS